MKRISENTLKKWRREALLTNISSEINMNIENKYLIRRLKRLQLLNTRILRLTKYLIDDYLIEENFK